MACVAGVETGRIGGIKKRYWGMWKRDGFSLECGSCECEDRSSKRSLTYQSHFPRRRTLDIFDSYIQGELTRLRSSIKLNCKRWRIVQRENLCRPKRYAEPGGRTPHMKGVGMLVGNFELNPKRRPIWAWLKLFLTPKRNEKIYICPEHPK